MHDSSKTNQGLTEETSISKKRIQKPEHSEAKPKQWEEALQDSEKLNALKAELLWNVPMITAFHDLEFNVVWANKAYEEATGLSVQEMAGKKCYSVWGRTKLCRNCPMVKVIDTGKPATAELIPQDQDHVSESQRCWL